MKIILPGGSGQIGVILTRHFLKAGHEVVVLSRHPQTLSQKNDEESETVINSHPAALSVVWDGQQQGLWSQTLDGADVVINLAGRSVNCRYNPENQQRILDSRVDSTRAIGQAIAQCQNPPKLWLQSSTATIYAHRYDDANDEATGIIDSLDPSGDPNWKYSVKVAKAWEAAAVEFQTDATRQVLLRSAMVMSPDADGVFDVLRSLVRRGLGGRNGDGKQFVSWIHEVDFCACIDRLISDRSLSGPVNIASPNPLPNAEFMRQLRSALGVRFGLPASKWMLELGAVLMKTETELLLKSRRVVPGKLMNAGFKFRFPTWSSACSDLVRRC